MTSASDDEARAGQLIFVAGEGPAPDGYVAALSRGEDGRWSQRHRRTGLPGALSLTRHPSLDRLYVAGSDAEHDQLGYVAVLGLPELDLISTQPSHGHLPCALSVDPSGRFLVVANYLDGALVVLALTEHGDIGELADRVIHPGHGSHPDRQDRSHVHQAVFDPAGQYLLVTDLGTDRIHTYTLDGDGRLHSESVLEVPAGHGPRHLVFAGAHRVLTTDELSSTVSWYDYQPETGRLTWCGAEPTTSRVSEVNYPSDLLITADGSHCLVGNRGNDTIGVFDISPTALSRTAELETGGHWPQHLAKVGESVWCALRDSDRIRALRLTDSRAEFLDSDIGLPRPNWILVDAR